MHNLIKLPTIIFMFLLVPAYANAADTDWHKLSDTYQVYLGVVPASKIKENPYLVDNDVKLHGGIKEQGNYSHHVMIAVFDKKTNARINDATVIVEVRKKTLIGGRAEEKPLQKMITSGTITYGNYFTLYPKEAYEIEIKIYRPNQNGSEELEFIFEPY